MEKDKNPFLEIPVPQGIIFDDRDISSVIYGEFRDSGKINNEVINSLDMAVKHDNLLDAFEHAWQLLKEEIFIPLHVYKQIRYFIIEMPSLLMKLIEKGEIGKYPCTPFELYEQLWKLGNTYEDNFLLLVVGHGLQLQYEGMQRSIEYRNVNTKLLEIIRRHNMGREYEAIRISNIGFSYMMECNWRFAIKYFEDAIAKIRYEHSVEVVNMRLNLMISRFGERNWAYDEELWNAVVSLGEYLRRKNDWRERKSLVCLSRVKEAMGNLDEAIEFMRQAVRIGETENNRYLEMDRSRLDCLKNKATP